MYLQHFGFNEFPFSLTPNLRFFCNLEAYKEALNVITVSLYNGEGFVKITGEVGTGKTLLCRKVLNTLGNEYKTAYISNPTLDTFNLQKAIARELEIAFPENIDNHGLLNLLTNQLIEIHKNNKRVIIIIDEAHVLSDESLEGLRLLSNLETETTKLMQIILVGQPELDKRLKKSHLRQLKQRIVFSYNLPTLRDKEFLAYVSLRLTAAGYNNTCDALFSRPALKLLFKASQGIPRLINILSHKALLITYGYNKKKIDIAAIKMAVADTGNYNPTTSKYYYLLKIGIISLSLIALGLSIHFILKSFSI
ncbi:MAG: MSHA biogenesis protein MshM (Pilus type IV) [uncultured bacterium]|nr:MAG: MSHA biogenesis protein MshM (Pilus type IV) [uncultured bacterium]